MLAGIGKSETDRGPLVTNALVIPETVYTLRRGLGGVTDIALLAMVRDGTLMVVNLLPEDRDRVAELVVASNGQASPVEPTGVTHPRPSVSWTM